MEIRKKHIGFCLIIFGIVFFSIYLLTVKALFHSFDEVTQVESASITSYYGYISRSRDEFVLLLLSLAFFFTGIAFFAKRYIRLFSVLLCVFFISGCSNKPSDLKGYYQPLVQKQCSLNNEDTDNKKDYVHAIAEGEEPSMKYYFEINNKYYYVASDNVYSKEGDYLIGLEPDTEGYFTDSVFLYYVYGEEEEREANTLGGPVVYNLKHYKYSRLDITTLDNVQIKKDEYERLYFKIAGKLN